MNDHTMYTNNLSNICGGGTPHEQLWKYAFTIFTPTYNRAHSIRKVFDSLQEQSFKNFEWIVIDDGSSDSTGEIIEKCKLEATFPITYVYQNNSGKHVAQNRAVDIAQGLLFLPLDSDDVVLSAGLEALWNAWCSIPESEREQYSGVGCHCQDQFGNLIGTLYPQEHFISNDLEVQFIYKITGEKWGSIRTDIMRNYKNQEVKGHYLSESTTWFRIAQKYKKLYINKCCREYEVHSDSVTVGTKKNIAYNVESGIVSDLIYVNEFYDWYWKYDKKSAIRLSLRLSIRWIVSGRNCWIGKDTLLAKVKPISTKMIVILASPFKIVWKLKSKN